ncbi:MULTISPECIES: peroxiredoxin [unclassified Pusillimonas]|uniref:peroxiredoxin n=1 Tax=unclassified Pusillimonas TaxID=2640016 RepID=UPI000B9CC5F8|nr:MULTISPECIES: peroxiredoxin [unclassified Pusillimonas]OXR49243.1 peroxiredoxin [Pusillimonas sp. T2]ROT46161.1 peroxiredoxin [Pusillimonas sp. NJUB218]
MSSVTIGQPVPAFVAQSTQGEITENSLLDQWTVLYFYPKDSTPGCTTQAQNFRDQLDNFKAVNCQIIGVSRDSLKSHDNFTGKQSLPFALISDPDETLCTMFDVMKMKNMYGKQVRGVERSTFLIDPKGVLVKEWRGLRVPGHVDQVLQAVTEATR